MQITVNGKPQMLADNSTITDLLNANELADKPVAVEVNRTIIPRSLHARHQLQTGDAIEIVHAIGGG